MKNLQDLRIFIETARLGSLSACARHLDLSPAVVSAAIKRLEAEIET
ncbi:helix-turn-helix domain-containing protein, partial [Marinobacter sp. 1Y8]